MNVLKGAVTVYLVVLALELMFAWPAGILTSRRAFVRLLAWPVVAAWNIYYILSASLSLMTTKTRYRWKETENERNVRH